MEGALEEVEGSHHAAEEWPDVGPSDATVTRAIKHFEIENILQLRPV